MIQSSCPSDEGCAAVIPTADEETEITLGNGRLLGLFFGLVVLCGVFFVMGYMLGKNSAPGNTLLTDSSAGASGEGAVKPGAIQSVAVPTPAPAPAPVAQQQSTPETAEETAPEPEAAPEPEPARPAVRPSKPAEPVRTASPAAGSFIVQVAAVSKQQDADALAAALRRKKYAVVVSNKTGDGFFHIQIGPFGDAKQAESVRSRLLSDGYNPILKK